MSGFAEANARGKQGEQDVAARWGGDVQPSRSDFDVWIPWQPKGWRFMAPGATISAPGGVRVEVKTDSRSHLETPFCYIERWTVRPDGSRLLGGLWRAARDGVDAFVYYYGPSRHALLLFELKRLVVAMESHPNAELWRRAPIGGMGANYRALGRLIPRTDLIECAGTCWREEDYGEVQS